MLQFKYYELTERQRSILLKVWAMSEADPNGVVSFEDLRDETGEPNLMSTLNVLKRQHKAIAIQKVRDNVHNAEVGTYIWATVSRAEIINQINGLVRQIRETYKEKTAV